MAMPACFLPQVHLLRADMDKSPKFNGKVWLFLEGNHGRV